MARTYLAVETQTNLVLGQLPLSVDGSLSAVIGNYSSSSFTLPVSDKKTPSNWEALIEPQKMSIWVLDSFFKEPLWAGQIVDNPRNSNDEVTLDCVSFEGHFANRIMKDCVYNDMDPMTIFRKIIEDNVEFFDSDTAMPELGSFFTGIGVEFDLNLSALNRSVDYKAYNDQTVLSALEDWAKSNSFEWTIKPRFVDPVARTGLRKVVTARYKTLGTVTDTPNHQFLLNGIQSKKRSGDLGGNITSFSYSEATNGGAYATYMIAVGDGSGNLRTQSQPIRNSPREASGYPRVEARKPFNGVKYTDDVQFLGEAEAKQLFSHHDIITLEAHDNGATNLQSMELGDSALVTIKTDSLPVKKVLRLVGWSVGNDSQTFSPTLAELGADPAKFKSRVDPLAPEPEPSTTGTNPNENGVYVPSPDGGAWVIDPVNGFGSFDANDNFVSSDFGGGGGGGAGGGGGIGTIKSINTATKTGTVLMDGDTTPIDVRLSAEIAFNIGDIVPVMLNSDSTKLAMVVDREKVAATPSAPPVNYRATGTWPKDAVFLDLAYGPSFTDVNNVFGYGPDSVVIDSSQTNNVFRPISGEVFSMTSPSGMGYISNATNAYNGYGYRWFLDGSSFPRLHIRDGAAIGGWRNIDDLPVTPGTFTTGRWSLTSMTKEVFSQPIVVTARVTQTTTVVVTSTDHRIPVEIKVWSLDSAETMTPYTFTTQIKVSGSSATPFNINAATYPLITTYGAGGHVFFALNIENWLSTNDSFEHLFHVDIGQAVPVLNELLNASTKTTIASWVGTSANIGSSTDGMLFGAGGGFLYRRALTDSGPINTMFDNIPSINAGAAIAYPARDRLTGRFFIAARTLMADPNGTNQLIGCLFDHDVVFGTKTTIPPKEAIGSGGQLRQVNFPRQMPDNSVVVNLDLSNAMTTNANTGTSHGKFHELHRIEPF